MKKILNIFILCVATFFIFLSNVFAEEVKHFSCEYNIVSPNGNYWNDLKIEVLNYNNGSGGDVSYYYLKKKGEYIEYTGQVSSSNWIVFGKLDKPTLSSFYYSSGLRILPNNSKSDFVKKFKDNGGKCPNLYSTYSESGGTVDIEYSPDSDSEYTNSVLSGIMMGGPKILQNSNYTPSSDNKGFLSENPNSGTGPQAPDISIIDKPMTCEEILGEGAKIIKLGINVLRIAGVIIALLNGMMAFIPAVSSGDKGELNKAFKKCINMAIILILIVLIPELINVIGNLFGWDTSCIFG